MRVKYDQHHKERLREEISNEWFNLPDYVQQYIEILEQETADDFNLILKTKELLSEARTKEDIFKLRQAENGLFYRIFQGDERI